MESRNDDVIPFALARPSHPPGGWTDVLASNERRVAEDRRDCYWLYVVTNCAATPAMQEPVRDPARFPWHEVAKAAHYWLEVNAMTGPMHVREDETRDGASASKDGGNETPR